VRAQQTAQIVGDRFNLTINVTLLLAPGFDLTKLTAIVRDLPNVKELMVVGHEPDFSQTITSLIGGGRIVMKKGGLARVEILSIEPLAGQLVWLLAPKVLAET
jgi:phosphohistidine phosphatase